MIGNVVYQLVVFGKERDMNKRVFIAMSLIVLFGFIFCSNISAWNEKVTHKELSEYAAESSSLSKVKGDYLKNLGINNNLDEYLIWGNNRKKIRDWLQTGAEREDASSSGFPAWPGSTTRSFNHFHNPLKEWSQAGLNDAVLGKSYTGESSLFEAKSF